MKEITSQLKTWAIVIGCGFLTSALTSAVLHFLFAGSGMSPWIVLDFAVETLFFVAIYTFSGSLKTSIFVIAVLDILFQVANTIKIAYLGMPVLPTDFFLIEDAVEILPPARLILYTAIVVVPLTLCAFVLYRSWKRPRGWAWIGIVPFLVYGAWVAGFPDNYSNAFNVLLKNKMFGIPFLIKERGEALGVPLSFSIDLAKLLALERMRPSDQQVRQTMKDMSLNWTPVHPLSSGGPQRNVYIFLTESFWNPSEMVNFKQPLLAPNFLTLWKGNGSHHMLSPMFGGGTANVEFELLCGIPARSITKGIVFQVALANRMNCLPSLLKQMGYRTFAFHPFAPGYYNRNVAFPLLGFEDFVSIKDFKPDAESDSFIADDAFLHESVARARAMADGKPFLAYMMTFAGHWPYTWLPKIYERKIVLDGKDQQPDLEILERHLNVNRISSDVLARMTSEVLAADPTALILIAGDHLPGLAKDLYKIQDGETITDWHFYQTPLVLVDGLHPDVSDLPPQVPTYLLGGEILDRLAVPKSDQAHFPWFHPPMLIRPVQSGATLVKTAVSDYQICTPQSSAGDCPKAQDWMHALHVISMDLVAGAQYSEQGQTRLPANESTPPTNDSTH